MPRSSGIAQRHRSKASVINRGRAPGRQLGNQLVPQAWRRTMRVTLLRGALAARRTAISRSSAMQAASAWHGCQWRLRGHRTAQQRASTLRRHAVAAGTSAPSVERVKCNTSCVRAANFSVPRRMHTPLQKCNVFARPLWQFCASVRLYAGVQHGVRCTVGDICEVNVSLCLRLKVRGPGRTRRGRG